jgi:2-oxoglutarate/2-oxoacid ferredoxin oxidoreductase subunit alpha
MPRISLKIVGASGQGINTVGAIVAKGLKRSGYCVFGYREYPSLIKGGHASYQLDVSNERICSTETKVNVLVALNHHGLELNMDELKQGGIVLHVTPRWQFPEQHRKLIAERSLRVIYFPVDDMLNRLGARAILSNVLLTAFVWSMLDQDVYALKSLVGETFAKKKALLELNMRCIDEGYSFVDPEQGTIPVALPPPDKGFASHLLITGSQAMGLGAVHAGVRLYAGYPMTPSSPLLSFIAELENKTHMVVKQAEDEITAAQIVSGAMYMGTRALTATSGVGFDLMSETLSLNAMIENPAVFVLAQRPGPATGLPTWTAQGGLLQAASCSAGEFTRCVISVSNSQDAFDLMPVAFNLAEQYQISVIVLTDKEIAEALYTQAPYDLENAKIDRGRLVVDPEKLKFLKSSDRFNPHAQGGISLRWLPGSDAATYCARGDEHNSMGAVDESGLNAKLQMEKRLRKLHGLKMGLPAPRLSVGGRSAKTTDWMDAGDEIELLARPVERFHLKGTFEGQIFRDTRFKVQDDENGEGASRVDEDAQKKRDERKKDAERKREERKKMDAEGNMHYIVTVPKENRAVQVTMKAVAESSVGDFKLYSAVAALAENETLPEIVNSIVKTRGFGHLLVELSEREELRVR